MLPDRDAVIASLTEVDVLRLKDMKPAVLVNILFREFAKFVFRISRTFGLTHQAGRRKRVGLNVSSTMNGSKPKRVLR